MDNNIVKSYTEEDVIKILREDILNVLLDDVNYYVELMKKTHSSSDIGTTHGLCLACKRIQSVIDTIEFAEDEEDI